MERFWMFFPSPSIHLRFWFEKVQCSRNGAKFKTGITHFSFLFFFQSHSFSSFLSFQILIQGKTLDWFNFYLHNRTQQCLVNDCLSDVFSLKCGVPGGAILDPLLVLSYMNDLPNCLSFSQPWECMLMTSKLHMLTFLTCHWFPFTWISIGRFPKAFFVVFEFRNEVKRLKTSQPEAFPFAWKDNKENGLSETENKAHFTVYKSNLQRFGNLSVQLKFVL